MYFLYEIIYCWKLKKSIIWLKLEYCFTFDQLYAYKWGYLLFLTLFFFLGKSSGCCPGASWGPSPLLGATKGLVVAEPSPNAAPKDLNLAYYFFY